MNKWKKNVKVSEIEGGHDDEKKVSIFFSPSDRNMQIELDGDRI